MKFLYPEFLLALFAVAIPIIIHLFYFQVLFSVDFKRVKYISIKGRLGFKSYYFGSIISTVRSLYLNDENHAEYESLGFTKRKIIENLKNRTIDYNHSAKKNSSNRFQSTKLEKVNIDLLPDYILDNLEKYKDWIDN